MPSLCWLVYRWGQVLDSMKNCSRRASARIQTECKSWSFWALVEGFGPLFYALLRPSLSYITPMNAAAEPKTPPPRKKLLYASTLGLRGPLSWSWQAYGSGHTLKTLHCFLSVETPLRIVRTACVGHQVLSSWPRSGFCTQPPASQPELSMTSREALQRH